MIIMFQEEKIFFNYLFKIKIFLIVKIKIISFIKINRINLHNLSQTHLTKKISKPKINPIKSHFVNFVNTLTSLQ